MRQIHTEVRSEREGYDLRRPVPIRFTWRQRRARAAKLQTDHPHAAELLAFYARVLELQEALYQRASGAAWTARAAAGGDGRLDLAQLSGWEVTRLFRRFARDVQPAANDVLAPIAARLGAARSPAPDLLAAYVEGRPLDELAARLDCEPAALELFACAFLQPLAEAAAQRCATDEAEPGGPPRVPGFPARCPRCGRLPLLDLLRDEPETKGGRYLLCALCATAWRFPRATCPACGETRAAQLKYHETDVWPHLRVGACASCGVYLKTVDLRSDGRAVPSVDELASVELDLWAEEQGLAKLQRNLLGL